METKEYIVALHEGVDYDQFWAEIENSTTGLAHVPDRPVAIADNLLALNRITHYFLTDAEAITLRNDPRVLGVEIPAEHRDDIVIRPYTIQTGNFTKPSNYGNGIPISSGTNVNWGLIRHNNTTNVYGSGTTTALNYNYAADGSNVDIIIIDSGIQADHPEFQYTGNTTSRVQKYQWDSTVNTSTFYTDYLYHGTHCAGISAGKTYGWAKNANIYAIKFTADAADPDKGFSGRPFSNIANIIAYWHSTVKSVNPATGYKNPTVINMSFGYIYAANANPTYYTVSNVNYRGSTINSPGWNNDAYGLHFYQNYQIPYTDATYNTLVDSLLSNNIIVCKSAGNDQQKIDLSSGTDYNNYIWVKNNSTLANTQCYYMRGSAPMSANALTIGSLDVTPISSTVDKKASYSNAGPGVDIFVAGTNILSAASNIANMEGYDISNYNGTNFRQATVSGTSMASPQIAGIAALYLQANPTATPAQVKTWLLNNATANIYANTANVGANDYGNTSSQWGGNARVAYQAVQGLTQIKDTTGTWKYVANVRVKTDATTWSNVRAIWTKVDSTTWKQTF